MSSVISETIEIITKELPLPLGSIRIEDVVVGIFFTGVKLSTGHSGVAFTPIGEIPEAVCCPTTAARMPQAGAVEERPLPEIMSYCLDRNVLKSAVGVATLNALSQLIFERVEGRDYSTMNGMNGFDLLRIQPHETVSLIGAFGPYIRRLKTMGNPFFIVEKNPQTLRPDELQYFRTQSDTAPTLEASDVVILTGTAIVNQTIDSILGLLGPGKRTAIIGPTASMVPDAFFERAIQVMAGVRIADPDRMIRILMQGGSAYHLLKECSEKIAFVKR